MWLLLFKGDYNEIDLPKCLSISLLIQKLDGDKA